MGQEHTDVVHHGARRLDAAAAGATDHGAAFNVCQFSATGYPAWSSPCQCQCEGSPDVARILENSQARLRTDTDGYACRERSAT